MTAPQPTAPSSADPVGDLNPTQHAAALTGALVAVADDAARFGLRPVDLSMHLEFGFASVQVQMDGGNTAAVDALAGAYGLTAAATGGELYSRSGPVTLDGQPATVTVYCGLPVDTSAPTPQAALPAVPQSPAVDAPMPPAVDGGPQPLQVAAVRADAPAVPA